MRTEITACWMIVNGRLDMYWTALETMQLLEMDAMSNPSFREAAQTLKAA